MAAESNLLINRLIVK